MKLKRHIRNAMLYSFIIASIGTVGASISYAGDCSDTDGNNSKYSFAVPQPSQNKKMLVLSPKIPNSNDYEQQANVEVRIDKISFPKYLRYKNGGDTYVQDYPDNSGLSIKTNAIGYVYYRPNIADRSILSSEDQDIENIGSEYLDYAGDLSWNFKRRVYGTALGDGELVGAIDGMRNFKPSQVAANTKYVMNKWPAWPVSESDTQTYDVRSIAPVANASAYGSEILITKFLEDNTSGKKYAYKNKYRNCKTRELGNKVTTVKGEWRYIGASADGGWISNPIFPPEGMEKSINVISPMDKNWNVLSAAEKGVYNDDKASGDVKIVRDRTIDKFVDTLFPRRNDVKLTASEALKYFNIAIPYGPNVSSVLQGYYGTTGNFDATLLSDGAIDIEVASMKIKNDKGQQIYSINQTTTTNGVTQGDIVVDSNTNVKKGYTTANVNLRTGAGTNYAKIITIPIDSGVEIISKGSSWSQVKYNGRVGYMSSQYLVEITRKATATEHQFIRKGASWSAEKTGLLYKGQQVNLIEKVNSEFSKIEFNDLVGYVTNQYITENKSLSRSVSENARTSSKIKLQPGRRYNLEVTLKNRASGHIVYNPTINVLLDSKPNVNNDFISDQGSANAYGVYVMGHLGSSDSPTLKKNVAGVVSSISGKGWYSVLGERLIRSNGQKVVPGKNASNTISPKGSKTMNISFYIDGANNENEMNDRFGTKDPNAVQMRLATKLNDKHQISDNVFYAGGVKNVDTSVDDLYDANNSLATNSWSASQDLSISGANDYTLKDAKGNTVKDEIMKGEDYTLRVKVYNGSKIWDTSMTPKVNYVITDAATGAVLVSKKTVTATGGVLAKSTGSTVSSRYIDIPIRLEKNVSAKEIKIQVEISEEHNTNYDDWYNGNNTFALKLGLRSPVDLTIKESMGDIVGDGLPQEILVFSGETINLMSEISSNVDYGVGPVKVKFTRTPANEVVEKQVSSLDMSNTQEIAYTFKAPTVSSTSADKIYTVTAEINPEGTDRIEEVNYNNNKVTFKVRVTGDISKFGCTSIIKTNLDDKGRPSGLAKGNTEKYVDSQFTSYVPTVTVKRRDKISGSFGSWYDYPIQLKSAQLKVKSKESHVIESVLFKSKFTTDRYAERLDRDKINSEGFIDIIKYPNYAKVKAGYGFEIKVKTLYKTNIKESYIQGISKGMDTKLSTGKTVYEEVLSRVNTLNQNNNCELKTDKSTMKVVFTPEPETVTMNAKDEVLCMMMPNGKEIYTSIATSKKLVERMPRENTDRNNVYSNDIGVEFNYQFTNRDSGVGGVSRKYYIDENTTNTTNTNKYYLRLATNKLGVGGLTYALSNGVYDMKDLEIIVYGGRDEDLKDTSN